MKFRILVVMVGVACSALQADSYSAQVEQQPAAPDPLAQASLKRFLQDYAKDLAGGPDSTTRYISVSIDLNGDGTDETIVYVIGQSWCGSGGCPMLILARKGSSYKVMTRVSIVQTPISVLTSVSHDWRDLGVWVRGGSVEPGYEAKLAFDGRTYPRNPSVPPARRLIGKVPSAVLIPSSEGGVPLYP